MSAALRRVAAVRELPVALALALMIGITGSANHAFLGRQGVRDILVGVSVVALLAVGQSFVIVMRHVDLSIGSTVGLSAYLVGHYLATHEGHGLPVAMAIGLMVGVAVGALNGALVGFLKLPSLVVTLGTLYLVRGLSNQVVAGDVITADKLPSALHRLGSSAIFGVPYLFLIVVVAAVAATVAMRALRPFRDLFAMGSNPTAAGLVGIPVARRTFGAFVLCGAVTGLAGTLLLARFNAADANSGLGIELNVVAACVVGGVAIAGGVGTAAGAVLGALLLQSITLALGALGVSQFWQQAVNGTLLIVAIALDRLIAMRTVTHRTIRAIA